MITVGIGALVVVGVVVVGVVAAAVVVSGGLAFSVVSMEAWEALPSFDFEAVVFILIAENQNI